MGTTRRIENESENVANRKQMTRQRKCLKTMKAYRSAHQTPFPHERSSLVSNFFSRRWSPFREGIRKRTIEVMTSLLKVAAVVSFLPCPPQINRCGNVGLGLVGGLLQDASRIVRDHCPASVCLISCNHGGNCYGLPVPRAMSRIGDRSGLVCA